jgi:hypothetical protein
MRRFCVLNLCIPIGLICSFGLPVFAQSSSSHSSKKTTQPSVKAESRVDDGAVVNGVYRNRNLGLMCKIPAGWVLRTAEINSQDQAKDEEKPSTEGAQGNTGDQHVLLAAFSRPPEARGEEINSSILIAAESVDAYPGLKDAAQYFGPLTEVAKAQGFGVDEEPYEFALGAKTVVRGDFHKDVGTRVMRQSTLAFLSHGYAISITVIGGSEDEMEELIDGVSFGK